MKHETISPSPHDVPVAGSRDDEIEAHVFRNLEMQRQRDEEDLADAIVVQQYPDTRTPLHRVAAWWHLRYRPVPQAPETNADIDRVPPVWQGHWSLTRYL